MEDVPRRALRGHVHHQEQVEGSVLIQLEGTRHAELQEPCRPIEGVVRVHLRESQMSERPRTRVRRRFLVPSSVIRSTSMRGNSRFSS